MVNIIFQFIYFWVDFNYLYFYIFLEFQTSRLQFINSLRVNITFNEGLFDFSGDSRFGLLDDISHELFVNPIIKFGLAIIDLPQCLWFDFSQFLLIFVDIQLYIVTKVSRLFFLVLLELIKLPLQIVYFLIEGNFRVTLIYIYFLL